MALWSVVALSIAVGWFVRLSPLEKIEFLTPRRGVLRFARDADVVVRAGIASAEAACNCSTVTFLFGGAAYHMLAPGPRTLDVDFQTGFVHPPANISCFKETFAKSVQGVLEEHPHVASIGRWMRRLGYGDGVFVSRFHAYTKDEYFRWRLTTDTRWRDSVYVFESLFHAHGAAHMKMHQIHGVSIMHPQMLFFHAHHLATEGCGFNVTSSKKGRKRLAYAASIERLLGNFETPPYQQYECGHGRSVVAFMHLVGDLGRTPSQARRELLAGARRACSRPMRRELDTVLLPQDELASFARGVADALAGHVTYLFGNAAVQLYAGGTPAFGLDVSMGVDGAPPPAAEMVRVIGSLARHPVVTALGRRIRRNGGGDGAFYAYASPGGEHEHYAVRLRTLYGGSLLWDLVRLTVHTHGTAHMRKTTWNHSGVPLLHPHAIFFHLVEVCDIERATRVGEALGDADVDVSPYIFVRSNPAPVDMYVRLVREGARPRNVRHALLQRGVFC